MKYIKLFEDTENTSLYEEVSSIEYYNTCGISIPFNNYEMNMFTNMNYIWSGISWCKNQVCNNGSFSNIFIHKVSDDWFYVQHNSGNRIEYYKCDQWDGLISCLRDKVGITHMKNTKLFEDLNVDGYEEITSIYDDETANNRFDQLFTFPLRFRINHDYFSPAECQILVNMGLYTYTLPYAHDIDDEPGTYTFIDIMAYYKDINIGKYNRLRGAPSLYIHKSNDEWYYVVVSCILDNDEKTFKCDQFDGLLNCLKSEFNL